jgi:hypothetical protein
MTAHRSFRDVLADGIRAGMTLLALSRKHRMSRRQLRLHLESVPGLPALHHGRPRAQIDIERAASMRRLGYTFDEIGARFGVSEAAIRARLRGQRREAGSMQGAV